MYACEKCIELLLSERHGHTLVIHSKNEDVIRQFALKKPVGRVLVNTSASFGSMGITTNLFPALTLGSGSAGEGMTSDNVSPMNLIYIRKVGYGVRKIEDITNKMTKDVKNPAFPIEIPLDCDSEDIKLLQDIFTKAMEQIK